MIHAGVSLNEKWSKLSKKERTQSKMKMRFKRFLSGFMAVATLASVIVQPVTVSASELEPEPTSFEQQYPELQDVQDTLDKDEIVEAKDIEIPYGEELRWKSICPV